MIWASDLPKSPAQINRRDRKLKTELTHGKAIGASDLGKSTAQIKLKQRQTAVRKRDKIQNSKALKSYPTSNTSRSILGHLQESLQERLYEEEEFIHN